MDTSAIPAGVAPGVVVVVLGPAPATVVRALWGAGLRPVRGQIGRTLWALPQGVGG